MQKACIMSLAPAPYQKRLFVAKHRRTQENLIVVVSKNEGHQSPHHSSFRERPVSSLMRQDDYFTSKYSDFLANIQYSHFNFGIPS